MSLWSDIVNTAKRVVHKVEQPFQKPVSTIESYANSLKQYGIDFIRMDINQVLEELGNGFSDDALPLIQGIAALFPPDKAEKIISDPLSANVSESSRINFGDKLGESYIQKIIDPVVINAIGDAGTNVPVVTLTPTFSIASNPIGVPSYFNHNVNYNGNLPSIDGNSIDGGLGFGFFTDGSINLQIGLNLKIDIPERGVFQLPSYGLTAATASSKRAIFQDSDGAVSISGGIGFGGMITNNSDNSISLELDTSLLLIPSFNFESSVSYDYSINKEDIAKIYFGILKGDNVPELVESIVGKPKFYSNLIGGAYVENNSTIKASVNGKTVDASSGAFKDALTGLEIELDVNPNVTASLGVILKEENTGVDLASLNIPFTLANKISLDAETVNSIEDGEFKVYDHISADIGLNLQALGASAYSTFSLPGFVWDIGSLDEPLGTVNLLNFNPTIEDGIELFNSLSSLASPNFVPSGKLTFDGIELASTNI